MARQQDYPAAIEAFKHHVEEEPEQFFGFNAVAICYKKMRDPANAMKNFQRALEFAEAPKDKAKVLANIGNLYLAAGKPQTANIYYEEARTHAPENLLILASKAQTFITLEDWDRARRVLKQAQAIEHPATNSDEADDRGMGHYLLAHCYANLSEKEEEPDDRKKVAEYAELALAADPDRFVRRFEKELTDAGSSFHRFKDDNEFRELLKKYRDQISFSSWLTGR